MEMKWSEYIRIYIYLLYMYIPHSIKKYPPTPIVGMEPYYPS